MAYAQRAAALALLAGVSLAHATGTTLTLKTDGYTSTGTHAVTTVTNGWNTEKVDAGTFQVSPNLGASFMVYCAEITQYTSSSFQTYTVGTFGLADQKLLEGLFSSVATFTGSTKVDSSTEYAAVQLAVWEIMHESNSKLSLGYGMGSFYVNDTTTAGVSLANLANSYLTAAANWTGPSLVKVDKLSNSSYQDLVRVTAVPEPASVGLMALGLLGVAAVRRRGARG